MTILNFILILVLIGATIYQETRLRKTEQGLDDLITPGEGRRREGVEDDE